MSARKKFEDDGEPTPKKIKRLTAKLEAHFAEAATLEKAIRKNLTGIEYGR